MFAGIAAGETRITNYAASADCASTLECLAQLGVEWSRDDAVVTVRGRHKYGLTAPNGELDCGNSGTTMRLISGILAGQPFESTLTGDDSLRGRPMRRVIDPLTQMGAKIDSNDGKPPLTITGQHPLSAIEYNTPVASAQIKSCVLLAGLYSDGTTAVIESVQTRDHTERMLDWFGVDVETIADREGSRITIDGSSVLRARDLVVPGDISAAAFFMVAAAGLAGSDITMRNVGMNPTRSAIFNVLRALGANIEVSTVSHLGNEPVADIRVKGGLGADDPAVKTVKGHMIANLIDEIPILAVLGTQITGGVQIRDAAELRVKETDRIAAVCRNLELMGAEVEEYDDGFRVGPARLRGATVESYGDHRIAMAFAVAGIFADGETEIVGADCAAVSFPGFFETLEAVVRY